MDTEPKKLSEVAKKHMADSHTLMQKLAKM
jgi:hypothetical protein